jgi:integral membrane protein
MKTKKMIKEYFNYFLENYLDLTIIAILGIIISRFINIFMVNTLGLRIIPSLLNLFLAIIVTPTICSLIELEIYYSKIWKRNFNLNEMINRLDSNIIYISVYKTINILLWSLLFVIPGIIKYLEYSRAIFIYHRDPSLLNSEIFKMSKEQINGHEKDLLIHTIIMSFITGLIVSIAKNLSISLLYYIASAITFSLLVVVNPIFQSKIRMPEKKRESDI